HASTKIAVESGRRTRIIPQGGCRGRRGMDNTRSSSIACCLALLLAGGFLFGLEARQPSSGPPSVPDAHRDVVARYCVSCHNSRLKTGGFALDAAAAADVAQNPEAWEKVVRKMRARQMPPVGLPRPDEATYQAAIGSLEQSLDRAAAAHPNPGRTDTMRR